MPKRGIGDRAEAYVAGSRPRADLLRAARRTRGRRARPGGPVGSAIAGFNALIDDLREQAATGGPVAELVEAILERTGLQRRWRLEDPQDETRVENLQELVSVAREFDSATARTGTLADFLERVALVADADEIPDGADTAACTLMTLHTAKGLEFPVVFLTGLEEEVFPHKRALSNVRELEEERRLAYVGITRARQRLYLTRAAGGTGGAARHSTPRPGSLPRSRPADRLEAGPAAAAAASSPRWSGWPPGRV